MGYCEKKLNVLYAAHDDEYAPFLGISMNSLFENNKEFDKITVYAVLGNVSKENINKLFVVADKYNRELIIVKSDEFDRKLEELKVPKYRGTYGTCYRLFFDQIIKDDVEYLVYIDCDTIIAGKLECLGKLFFQSKCVCAVLDPLSKNYKKLIGFEDSDAYFNAGVLFVDVEEWRKQKVTEKIFYHIKNVRAQYCNPDQDLLNIVLKGNVNVLTPEYNLMATFTAYSINSYRICYGLQNFYSESQIQNAINNPVIVHMYRFLGQFPWHINNMHPNNELFDCYLKQSPWKDYKKKGTSLDSFIFKTERLLYKIFPKTVFLFLFKIFQERQFNKQNKKLLGKK